ncbi:MAG: hypothetical protein WCD18_13605 [Thermosynechococcaceae cyanobacterium]
MSVIETRDQAVLKKLFQYIENSSFPENQAEYLAEEFNLKVDELFLLYLEYRKNSREKYTHECSILRSNTIGINYAENIASYAISDGLVYERRKSPPQARLKYGLLKSSNKPRERKLLFLKIKVNYDVKKIFAEEFSRYDFRYKISSEHASLGEVLKKIDFSNLDCLNLDSGIDPIVSLILNDFDIYYKPRIH